MTIIDLHCHTTASDGTATPTELIRCAAERGVDVVAVTDHDTVAGVSEAASAGASLGVRVVTGIELSTVHGTREIHMLGYFIDPANAALQAAVTDMSAQRRRRAERIVERLREIGYEIDMSDVLAQASGAVVARPHIARALVARGHVTHVRAAFSDGLIGDGGAAFVAREQIATVDALGLIAGAGGVAVIGHPGVSHHEGVSKPLDEEIIGELAASGLAGLEVDHPDHPPTVRDRLCHIAAEYDLVPTGGSDWHGLPEHTLGGWRTTEESFAHLEALATAGG